LGNILNNQKKKKRKTLKIIFDFEKGEKLFKVEKKT